MTGRRKFVMALIFLSLWGTAIAQRKPDPNVGNPIYRRQGIMDGNLVRTIFINWGEIAHWPDSPSGEWPKGSGHQYVDGVALVVQARTVDRHGRVIYPMETQYREFVDKGPKDELWGWAPLPGYFNPRSSEPAMSDDPNTWPAHWPDRPSDWDGYWNGFFGKGVMNADLETYFVFDDDPDEEWDFFPDPTDTTRRGLGLEVAARLFQWSQVLAEDCIFARYEITNEGKTSYDSTYFCFYIDWGVGGTDDSSDDTGDYDVVLDIAWAWDYDGFGTPGRWAPVGVAGFAFLESPGIFVDGFDNDSDGLVDERRDSGPGVWLSTFPYGVANVDAFRAFYDREPKPHWSGDEDQDWDSYEDLNGNGQWDPGEPLHDDVGADGVGPYDASYTGPDEGEADGIPTPGEPDFDYTDKDESDQIGLTGFLIFPVHTYELWNEEQNWRVFRSAPQPKDALQVTANLGMFFSSGPFPLHAGQTEVYSMALLFAEDAQDLARTKKTVQQIYNADYRFAKPPEKPRLVAIPGDGRVTLMWDDRAERSWDPFLQQYDFEGYRIYRSTEPEFLEARVITDAYGRLTFRKPIAQFDLRNGIKGLHPIDVEGIKFDLGNDTGLRHLYVDEHVENGQTYYYAVVSYDRGYLDTTVTGAVEGIAPSECPSVIKVDIAGNVQTDVNTAVVTPRARAAGYLPPSFADSVRFRGAGTGSLVVQFVVPDSVKDGRRYCVSFRDTSYFHNRGVPFFTVWDVTSDSVLVVPEAPIYEEVAESPLFDGLVLNIYNDRQVAIDHSRTGWLVGRCNYKVWVSFDPKFTSQTNPLMNLNTPYPADYEIRFADEVIDRSDAVLGYPATPVKFTVWNLTENKRAKFLFRDVVRDQTLTPDTTENIVIFVDNPRHPLRVATTWAISFETDTLKPQVIPPSGSDVYRIVTTKPFRTGDSFTFTVRAGRFDVDLARRSLDKIDVVPNPYVVTASWEPRSPFRFGRGERRLYFVNLPPRCTIRIYTLRGYLVDTIEHVGAMDDGAEPWDLTSKDGQDIAFGVYIYHVDAPGIGTKVGKFAVIK
ncbi:MAG: hypothetical protein ONB23_07365 [candidate division KSB1 bacterium]|nr:hypothetical protein [candidate division KSB1 bacterium]